MRRVLFVSQKYICAFLMLVDGGREIPFPGKEPTSSAPSFHSAQSMDGCQRRLSMICLLFNIQRTTMWEKVREREAHAPWPSREREGGRERGREGLILFWPFLLDSLVETCPPWPWSWFLRICKGKKHRYLPCHNREGAAVTCL